MEMDWVSQFPPLTNQNPTEETGRYSPTMTLSEVSEPDTDVSTPVSIKSPLIIPEIVVLPPVEDMVVVPHSQEEADVAGILMHLKRLRTEIQGNNADRASGSIV